VAGVSSVVIKIGAETASAVRELGKVDKALGETRTSGQKLQAGIQSAAVPAAVAFTALTAAAISSAKAAAEDAASREKLDSQIRRSTGATTAAISANETWIDSMTRQTAIADDELRPAMAQLVRATGDVHKSQQLLALSADLAAATGKPLATTTAAVAKGYAGSETSLKKLVPSLDAAAVKAKDWTAIQKQLNEEVGGAAADSAQTAAGQYKQFQIQIGELQESIGAGLLPILGAVVPVMTQFIEIAAQHPTVFLVIAGAVGVLSGAILLANLAISAYGTATTVAGAAQTVWNSSMVRSAIILARNTAMTVVYGARQIAVAAATKAWAIAQWLLNAAMSANPIGLAIIAVAALTAAVVIAYRHSATFRAIVQGAFAAAKSTASALVPVLHLIVDAMRSLWQAAGPVRTALVGAMEAILHAIQAVLDAISNVVGAISRIHFPSKPSWLPLAVPAAAGPGGFGAPRSGPVINVTISGAVDPEASAQAIRRVLTRYDRRRGNRPLGGGGGGVA